MLSKERIKKMIRLSDYENGQGSTDLRRIRYNKMDYVRLQVLKTIVSVVVASMILIALVAVYHVKYLLENALILPWKQMIIFGGLAIAVVCLISVIATIYMARKRYEDSAARARKYYATLKDLLKIYEKEEQGQEEHL